MQKLVKSTRWEGGWILRIISMLFPAPRTTSSNTYNGLGTPISITNYENALQACLQPHVMEAFSQLKFAPSQITLACAKSTQKPVGTLGQRLAHTKCSKCLFPFLFAGSGYTGLTRHGSSLNL